MKKNVQVVIQCRMNSNRLPGKALLPINGLPSVVLCAKRAANTALNVIVATSTAESDNILYECLASHGIGCVRGPLEDVFSRFLMATEQLSEENVIVRLTADNMFPDGFFVEYLVEKMISLGREYISASSPQSGLPYGLAAEAFTVRALRRCDTPRLSAYDREHVTPSIRREYGAETLQFKELPDRSHLRCTMDSFNDYQRILSVFREILDPEAVCWKTLCEILDAKQPDGFRIPYKMKNGRGIIGRMTLGAAQLGIDGYGAVNETKSLTQPDVDAIVKMAAEHGVTAIDCARAYGNAERRVGSAIKKIQRDDVTLITKLDPLAGLPEDAPERSIRDAVDASIFRSCYELGLKKLPVLLLHRREHYTSHRGLIWKRLLELREESVIRELGVSVYLPSEAIAVVEDRDIQHLQIPFNLLDRRWHDAGVPQKTMERPDLTVYARSVFLQGILLHPAERWPKCFSQTAEVVSKILDKLVQDLGRCSRADLCIAFVKGQAWIDSMVLGCDSVAQLEKNLNLMRKKSLDMEETRRVGHELPKLDERLLNPAGWNQD